MIRTVKHKILEMKCANITVQIGFKLSSEAWRTVKVLKKGEKDKTNIQLIHIVECVKYYKNVLNNFLNFIYLNWKWTVDVHWFQHGSNRERNFKRIKKYKNLVPGVINGELLKCGENRITTLISRHVNRITNKRKIPEEMR